MKHKTAELDGALLDAAVAMAEGMEPSVQPYRVTGDFGITFVRPEPVCVAGGGHFEPSTDWRIGGPIIEREQITVAPQIVTADLSEGWAAWFGCHDHEQQGPTPLIAAMRAYVASRLGAEVELP